jgi:hypothetical protein
MPEFTLPEFTRSLRALAVPSAPGGDHDRIFAPLLKARIAAHKAESPEAQMAAFDGPRLERAWRAAIAELAHERHRRSAPDARALVARLELEAAPLWAALATMRGTVEAATKVKSADRAGREAAWQHWVSAVQGVFRAADDWWRSVAPHLGGNGR